VNVAEARAMVRARARWFVAIVVALACCAYGASLAGDFVFDDVHSVSTNPAVQGLDQFWRLLTDPTAFSSTGQKMYRPVLLVSFALNAAISPAAVSLKAGNVLLHALVAALAFGWLHKLGLRAWHAFACLAVFAVHPLAAEAINLVSARSELLLVLGIVIAMRCQFAWLRGARPGLAMAGMLAGTAIACGSKETGVILPVLMVAQAALLRRQTWRAAHWGRAVRDVLPVVALVIGYLVLRKLLLGQATVSLLGRTGEDPTSGYGRTLVTHWATMGLLLPKALLQMVVPVGLSMDPPVVFRHTFADPFVLIGWFSLAAGSVAALWRGATERVRRLGVLLAWGTALPWIVIPLNMPLAEHRLYGPLLGVLALLAACLPRRAPAWLARPVLLRAAFGAVILAGITMATLRCLDFRDERLLWRAELAARPQSWRAWWGLGAASLRAGEVAAAREPLANAHTLCPLHVDVLRNYAECLVNVPDEVAEPFRSLGITDRFAARLPADPWARSLQAQAHLQAGRVLGDRAWFVSAEQLALSCLELAEAKGLIYRMAAAARRGAGDPAGALAHLETSIARGLDHFTVRLDRAELLRELGRHREAHNELLLAQRQAPIDPAVMRALFQSAQPPR